MHDGKHSSSALFHVEYDDGEAHDEDLKNDRFRWHGPRATSALVPYHKDMRPAMLELEAENVHGDKENEPVRSMNAHVCAICCLQLKSCAAHHEYCSSLKNVFEFSWHLFMGFDKFC